MVEDLALRAVEPPAGEIDPADDDRQHVVEVVRDASGQLADGLHLLDLAQLGFGRFALLGFRFERLVRLDQLAGAIGDRLFEAVGALRLRFRQLLCVGELPHAPGPKPGPRKIAPSPTRTPSQLR